MKLKSQDAFSLIESVVSVAFLGLVVIVTLKFNALRFESREMIERRGEIQDMEKFVRNRFSCEKTFAQSGVVNACKNNGSITPLDHEGNSLGSLPNATDGTTFEISADCSSMGETAAISFGYRTKSSNDKDDNFKNLGNTPFYCHLGCPANKKIWVGGCINTLVYPLNCWTTYCGQYYGPRSTICSDRGQSTLQVAMELCTQEPMPMCETGWVANGQRYCSFNGDISITKVSPEPSLQKTVEYLKNECPKERTMYMQICTGSAPLYGVSHPATYQQSPSPDVCTTRCNVWGGSKHCDWHPTAKPAFVVCSNEDLPVCPANWDIAEPRLACHLP